MLAIVKKWLSKSSLLFLMVGLLAACTTVDFEQLVSPLEDNQTEVGVIEGEWYSSKDEVTDYLITYDELPPNYLTKSEARELGWDNAKGNLWEVADGMSIGGDYFGNYEGLLADESGRDYYEADIDYEGGYRNAKRLIFSNDGLIYYTDDHYKSFEHLYGEE